MRRNKLDSEEQLFTVSLRRDEVKTIIHENPLAQEEMEIDPNEVYTIREAVDMLHIHPSNLRYAINVKKLIKAIKRGKSYEIPGTELIKHKNRLLLRENKTYSFEELQRLIQRLIPEIDKQQLEERLRRRGVSPEDTIPRSIALKTYNSVACGEPNSKDWSSQDQEYLDRLLQNPMLGAFVQEILNSNGNYTRNILACWVQELIIELFRNLSVHYIILLKPMKIMKEISFL
jgi:hypothetical protein